MDTEIRGLTDRFVARHTVDPALSNQWSFNRLSSRRSRPTDIFLENTERAVNTDDAMPTRACARFPLFQNLNTNWMESTAHNWPPALVSRATDSKSARRNPNQPTGPSYSAGNLDVPLPLISFPPYISNHTVESVEFTNNSCLASEQRVTRAAALMRRVMEEREDEQEQFRRDMNRREKEIRERRERERIGKEIREMKKASSWPEHQEAITGPWCTCPIEKITCNEMHGNCRRQKSTSRCSVTYRGFGHTCSVESTDNLLLALERRVEEACALVENILGEREEREIREQREREKRERKVREQEEASRWPQQQEAITGHSQWLCEHYRFPCSSQFYSCHCCHNSSRTRDSEEAQSSYANLHECLFCHQEKETIATVPSYWCTCSNANHKTWQDSICRLCGRRK